MCGFEIAIGGMLGVIGILATVVALTFKRRGKRAKGGAASADQQPAEVPK